MNCGICNEPTELWEDGGVICEDCSQKPRHRYYALLRPPGFAAVPDGWCLREIWTPWRKVEETLNEDGPDCYLFVHGWVEYAEPLPFERVWKFDLLPADDDAQEQYSEWYENRK